MRWSGSGAVEPKPSSSDDLLTTKDSRPQQETYTALFGTDRHSHRRELIPGDMTRFMLGHAGLPVLTRH
jgi:hypothetical protein